MNLVTGASGFLGGHLARTLADLEGSDAVRKVHVAEAVGYRRALG